MTRAVDRLMTTLLAQHPETWFTLGCNGCALEKTVGKGLVEDDVLDEMTPRRVGVETLDVPGIMRTCDRYGPGEWWH